MSVAPGLLAEARAWSAQDPDPATRAELDDLIARAEHDDAAAADLAGRFSGRLEFGTAGLRGPLGAGPMRMNRVLVAQAAAGLAACLLSREDTPSVVVGFDGRHNSEVFARDTVELMRGAGIRALLMPRLLPTPVLAFAVRHLAASAGVMVTASHNPAADNGYKVYLGGADGGSQIVPPADGEIAARIAAVAEHPVSELPRSDEWELVPEGTIAEYVRRTATLLSPASAADRPRVVYTAMHGVGWETWSAVLTEAGVALPSTVAAQLAPDPDFPTVPFPNPEEPGAMDLALAQAAAEGADLVIANDPDADRLAVGIPDAAAPGGWRRLAGNEVGVLLGWRAAEARSAEARSADAASADGRGTLACSLVSSPALGAIAREHGMRHVETLTGFKWISRAPGLVFGFEEALGYLVDPDKVRDKDGISAAAALLDLATALTARGSSIPALLEEIAARVGGYASGQISVRVADLAEIPRLMQRLRSAPPAAIGGIAVEGVDDFLTGLDGFPPNDILRFRLAGGSRVIVRPSGTEPKLKAYLDAAVTEGSGAERLAAAAGHVQRLDAGMRELLR